MYTHLVYTFIVDKQPYTRFAGFPVLAFTPQPLNKWESSFFAQHESSRNIRICQKRGLIYNEESGSNIIWPTTKVLNVHDNSQLGILTRLKSGKKCNLVSENFFKIC